MKENMINTNVLKETFGGERRWVNYRLEERDGKKTKVPYQPNGQKASSTNSLTWNTYDAVSSVSDKVGIVFGPDGIVMGVDIDHCVEAGKLTHAEAEVIARFIAEADTYTEISPSGTGLHLIFRAAEPFTLKKSRHGSYEIYNKGRFFTVTNKPYGEAKNVRTITLIEAEKLFSILGYPWGREKASVATATTGEIGDDELIQKMFSAKNGQKTKALYEGDISAYGGDESVADMALCAQLAFWTGKNRQQMERLWLKSLLAARQKTQDREEYRVRTISKAIESCKNTYSPTLSNTSANPDSKENLSQADILLRHIEKQGGVELFHDEQKEAYIRFGVSGHVEIWPCRSKVMRRWLVNEFWMLQHKSPNQESIKNVVSVLEGRAVFDGSQIELRNRSAWHDGELWYDLTNEDWQAIKVNADGWEINNRPPTVFRRYSHNRSQIIPVRKGDASLLLKYVNIKDPQHQILLLVYLVSCFIPDFPHVILTVFGSQGSAKSTLSKLLRRIIDPSIIEVASLPEKHNELVQMLAHHAFLFFDNISFISESTSDTLCKAVTGSGFAKRELYADDDDVIYSIKRCLGINGINLIGTRPDLLERSLLLELDRIEPANRKQEKEIMDNFERDLPIILGGVFDALVKAIKAKPSIRLTDLPRMADFAVWGCAIAESLGYTAKDFLTAYKANIEKQTETVLNEDILASAVISFMSEREEWKGTASYLLHELTNHASFEHVDVYEKYWPKASNILMRRLNALKISLKEAGVTFVSIPGTTREIVLKRIKKTDDTDDDSSKITVEGSEAVS